MIIKEGAEYIFKYPPEFVTLPDYTAMAGRRVKVIRQLGPDVCDDESQPMFLIEHESWVGHAFADELFEIEESKS